MEKKISHRIGTIGTKTRILAINHFFHTLLCHLRHLRVTYVNLCITLQYLTRFFNRQRCKYSDELPTVFCSFPLSETKKCYWRDFYAGGSTDFDKGVSTSRHSLSSMYMLSTKIYTSRGSISHSSKPKNSKSMAFICMPNTTLDFYY